MPPRERDLSIIQNARAYRVAVVGASWQTRLETVCEGGWGALKY